MAVTTRCMRTSHTRTVVSADPDSSVVPPDATATARTVSVWPRREATRTPARASHTVTSRSREPATSTRPASAPGAQPPPPAVAPRGGPSAMPARQ